MSKKAIPENVKKQADAMVQDFNRRAFNDPARYYTTRHKSSFLYLDRYEYGVVTQICRLKYVGSIDNWEFAIFKYSDGRYDPEEWFFPGAGFVDGTIEGAMKAGSAAYP